MSKYEYIDSLRNDPANTNPVTSMCRWLQVSTSGFYHWRSRPQSATAARREQLAKRIIFFFEESVNIRGCESRSWSGSEPVVIYLDGVGESHLWRVGEPPWLGSFRRVDRSRDERSMYPWYEKLSRS